jgi:hypothetical protein
LIGNRTPAEEQSMQRLATDAEVMGKVQVLMRRAFVELAASFASIDAVLADRAIHNIETMFAAEAVALREKLSERVAVKDLDAAFRATIGPLREMTQTARQTVQQAGKPRH